MHSIKQKERNFFDDFSFQEEAEAKAKEYVDLTESYTVLYDLFEKQGVVKSKDVNNYDADPNKLTFNFIHPTVTLNLDAGSFVIYDLVERKQLTYETSTVHLDKIDHDSYLSTKTQSQGRLNQHTAIHIAT